MADCAVAAARHRPLDDLGSGPRGATRRADAEGTMTTEELEKIRQEACRERNSNNPEKPFAAARLEVSEND